MEAEARVETHRSFTTEAWKSRRGRCVWGVWEVHYLGVYWITEGSSRSRLICVPSVSNTFLLASFTPWRFELKTVFRSLPPAMPHAGDEVYVTERLGENEGIHLPQRNTGIRPAGALLSVC